MHVKFHPLYVDYCTYFNGNQDYFECHEVLEEYWKEIAPGDKGHVLVGYVQLATGLYHWRRGNTAGALRILQKAQKCFLQNLNSPFLASINLENLLEQLDKSIFAIKENQEFQGFPLLFTNKELESKVQLAIIELEKQDETYLLHKHMLRDRTDILLAREEKRRSRR